MLSETFPFLKKFLTFLQYRVETTRFLFDSPYLDYQPLPWLGIKSAPIRGAATEDRWKAIRQYCSDGSSIKDIGCCVGYFCISATVEKNMSSFGVDSNESFIRIANYAKNFVKNSDNLVFFEMAITPKNAACLPRTDYTICFSIWHHWVLHFGISSASEILKHIWEQTKTSLFFETGEDETKDEFKLPYTGNTKEWLKKYLESTLQNSHVEAIGEFDAGKYEHYQLKTVKRTVFKIDKIQ